MPEKLFVLYIWILPQFYVSLNMKTLTQAFVKTADVIKKHVQTIVQEVTVLKPLQDFKLLDQIESTSLGFG